MSESRSAPPAGELSEISAAGGALLHPSDTFAALARKPTWWLPFVAGVLVSAVFSFVMTDKVDYDASMRQAIEKQSAKRGQTMSAEEMEKAVDHAVEVQRKVGPYYPTIGAAGFAFVFFLSAFVLAFAANAFGAEAKIPTYLALYSHAQIPLVLRAVYGTVRLAASADSSLTFEQIGRVGSVSAALLLPASASGALFALASSVDLFVLATVGLLVVALRAIPGLPRSSATAIPISLWAILVAVRVGWAAIVG